MVRPLKTINLVMASYSDIYCQSSRLYKLAASVLSSHKYFMNPELRAKQARKNFTFILSCHVNVQVELVIVICAS